MKLTHTKIRNLSQPGRYTDAAGLHLRVNKGGSKVFILRKVVRGKRKDIPLGQWPDLTLAEARVKASELRLSILQGEFKQERKRETPTFREAAAEVYDLYKPRWKNEKHTKNWWQSMEKYAFASIGDMRVDEVARADIIRILKPIWVSRAERARRLRQRMRSVFRWCEGNDYISSNPCGEGLDGVLPQVPRSQNRFRSLPYQELPGALAKVEASGASLSARLCFQFLALLALRSGEARNLTWNMVDEERALLIIPGESMKMNQEYRSPLSDEVLSILARARELGDEGLCFPSPHGRERPLSDMSLMAMLRRVGLRERMTAHGCRHSFKSWASEQGYDWQLSELQLAHRLPGLQEVYMTTDLLDRRREMMAAWGKFLAEN